MLCCVAGSERARRADSLSAARAETRTAQASRQGRQALLQIHRGRPPNFLGLFCFQFLNFRWLTVISSSVFLLLLLSPFCILSVWLVVFCVYREFIVSLTGVVGSTSFSCGSTSPSRVFNIMLLKMKLAEYIYMCY